MVNSEKNVSEIIKECEEKENLFSFMVRGVCIWRVFRSSVFSKLQNLNLVGEAESGKGSLLSAALKSLPGILYAITKRKKARYGVISYPVALKVPDADGRYGDFYYQSILEAIPGGVRLSYKSVSRGNKKARTGVLDIDLSGIYLLASILARVFPVRSKDGAYADLAAIVSKNFSVEGMNSLSLEKWFSVFWWRSWSMGVFFKLLGLHTILTINQSEYSMVSGAHAKGIKTIELQHGIYTENHPDALANHVILKYGKTALFLPDVIALYGDYWVDRLGPIYAGSSVHVMAVGNAACDWGRARRGKKHVKDDSKITVLVTTQGIQRRELAEFVKYSLAFITVNIKFIIKLHPSYDKDKAFYINIFEDEGRVLVVSGDESPATSDLLEIVDLHASIASACHYDALAIGVPTAVIGLPRSELMRPLIENGSAVLLKSPQEMANLINTKAWISPEEKIQEYYCKSGFKGAIEKLID